MKEFLWRLFVGRIFATGDTEVAVLAKADCTPDQADALARFIIKLLNESGKTLEEIHAEYISKE